MTSESDPGERMALLSTGDWWQYDGSGHLERGSRPMKLEGTIRVSIDEARADGPARRVLSFVPMWRIVGVSGPEGLFPMPQGLFFFEQDAATGDVLIAGDNMGPGGTTRFASVPQVFYPGTFGPETSYDNVLDFSPHGRVHNTLRVVGIEMVDTALGRHAAWKARIASESETFGRVEGVDWWRPGLGAPLCFEMTARVPDGSHLSTRAVLRAASRAIE